MKDDFRNELCMAGTIAELPLIVEFVDDACEQATIDPAAEIRLAARCRGGVHERDRARLWR